MIGGADGIPMQDLDGMLAEMERNLEIVLKGLEGAKAEMDAAVAAEREACAKIADEAGNGDVGWRIRCRTEGSRPPFPDSITTASVEVRWMGDSLTESPGAQAILASMPPGFQTTDELDAFYAGEQWTPEEKGRREGRLSLTLNMLPRLVALAMEKHITTPGGLRLTNEDCHFVRAYITARNRDAQMAYNYMASAALEASAPKSDARLLAPDELGKAVYEKYYEHGPKHVEWRVVFEKKYWIGLGRAAINFYLKQPKV